MTHRPAGRHGVLSAFVAAATAWVAMLSWRGFTEETSKFLVPLAVLAVLVSGLGALLRWWRAPGVFVVVAQVVVSGLVAAAFISGSALPVGAGWIDLRETFAAAQVSANTFAPPVPASADGVHPFLIAGGLGVLLLVDLVACTWRRAPLAGLPLLSAYSVPVGMLGIDLVWWVFVLTALGFLTMLYLDQDDRVRRWGRSLDSGLPTRPGGPATSRWHAGAIGGGVTGMAVLLPLVIPTLSVEILDIGSGPGGDSDITVVNPTTDLQRDLQQRRDVPLVRVTTDDPAPAYLRIATLTRLSGNEWSPGNRDIPSTQNADGDLPPLVGVAADVPRSTYSYDLEATDGFDSSWLPTPEQTTRIQARGDWRYDVATRDFIASDDDLSTAGQSWALQADVLSLDANALAASGPTSGLISSDFVALPDAIDPYVRDLGLEVTGGADSPFEKAVALQNWFRDTGDFTYDTSVDLGTGTDDLVRFLSPADGGRTGYCEQFASSMALMARQLGIPARVAVGFLRPEASGPGEWVYSSHDLHAWPELYFSGAGWVRFEPTPPTRASGVPDYTEQGVTPVNPDIPELPGGTAAEQLPRGDAGAAPQVPELATDAGATDDGSGLGWLRYAAGALGALVIGLLLLAPRVVRRRRRDRRRGEGVEAAWSELRDTALDLGLPWPERRSPRETGAALAATVHRVGLLPGLDRIVGALERRRFAPGGDTASAPDPSLAGDVDTVVEAMQETVSPGARRRAEWFPRSVLRRSVDGDPSVDSQDDPGADRLLESV